MKPLTLVLVAIISCVLSFSARAATLETSAGKPVPEGQVSAELIQAVADFEKHSIFVVDSDSDNITDVFIREDFYSLLGYTTDNDEISSYLYKAVKTNSAWFPVCTVVVVTRLEVDAKTGILSCGKYTDSSPKVRTFASIRWMARVEVSQDEFSSLDANGSSGVVYMTLNSKNYILRFKVTAQEMATRRNALKDLRRLIEEQRLAAEEERMAAARAEAERLKRRAEEVRRRAEAEKPALEARLKTIVSQAIMLDGVLAFPIKSVTAFAGWYAQTNEYKCVEVGEAEFNEYYNTQWDKTVCGERAWGTTNYVPLMLSDKLYVPVPVLNKLLSHVVLTHDAPSRTLNVRLTNEDKVVSTFRLALPSNVPAHRTVTQARIFKFSRDSAPKCSTTTLVRSSYTATISVGSANIIHRDVTEYYHLAFKFSNISNTPISIVWDDTILRLPDGQRSGVVQNTTDLSTRFQPQPPTVVAPRASHAAILFATTKIVSLGTPSDPLYYPKLFDITTMFDEKRNSLFVRGTTATVSGVLAVRVNGKKVFENFSVTCTTKLGEYRR